MLLYYKDFLASAQAALAAQFAKEDIAAQYIVAAKEPPFVLRKNLSTEDLVLNNLLRASHRRTITDLDIRCEYLQHLLELPQQANTQLAILSAHTAPVKVTAQQLIETAGHELDFMMDSPKRMARILANPLLSEYGFINTLAIKLQDPHATLLLPYWKIAKMGLALCSNITPISVFTPTQQPFIRREGQLIPLASANKAEQLAVLSGQLAVEHQIQYVLNQYYDVDYLNITERNKAQLLDAMRPAPAGYEQLLAFGRQLVNPQGQKIQIAELQMQGHPLGSAFDSECMTIYIKAALSESEKAWQLLQRLAEAVVHVTSTAPQACQALESQLLALQLANRFGIRADNAAGMEAFHTLKYAKTLDAGLPLEQVVASVNRMSHYIAQGVSETQEQQQTQQEQSPQREASQANREGLENFLEGIN